MEYCREHGTANCPCIHYKQQTKELIAHQEKCTKALMETLKPQPHSRKADVPAIIAQVITCIILVGFVVWQSQ